MSKPFKLFANLCKIIPVLSHIICLLCFIIMNIDVLIIHIKIPREINYSRYFKIRFFTLFPVPDNPPQMYLLLPPF